MAEMKNLIPGIGFDAGQLFHYLDTNQTGKTLIKATELKKELDFSTNQIYLALGWLARENQVEIKKIGNSVQVRLNQ